MPRRPRNKTLIRIYKFYNRHLWRIWGVLILLSVLAYNFRTDIANLVLPTPSSSIWQFAGGGITTGIVIMIIAIVIGIILIATGVGAPAGVFIILASMLFFGAKISGISALVGMIMNFFQEYRVQVLIVGALLIYFWIRKSSFSYTNRAPPPIGTMIYRR